MENGKGIQNVLILIHFNHDRRIVFESSLLQVPDRLAMGDAADL